MKKRHKPKYSMIYGNNHSIVCPDLGDGFDVDAFVERLQCCGVDYLTFNTRCNQGFAYYDTKIGIKHPALKYDLFGRLINACGERGIAVTAYMNGGLCNEEGIRHRDWTTLYYDGRSYNENRISPYIRTMCYNSPYREYLITMVKEVVSKYPVAGFFIDCLAPYPCVCPTCVRMMKEKGIDYEKEDEVRRFSSDSANVLCKDIAAIVYAVEPELLLYFNGRSYDEQIEFANLLECETVSLFGFDFLEVSAHHLRTLGDFPVINMITRFGQWNGDYGSLRPAESLKYELLYGLIHGMRPSIGSFLHPRGDFEDVVLTRVEEVFRDIQTNEEYFEDAENLADIAVVCLENLRLVSSSDKKYAPICGAVRMLEELNFQFDVISMKSRWDKYKIIILPDNIKFDDDISMRIKKHLAGNGRIISSGVSGIAADLPEWGIEFQGLAEWDPAYFMLDPGWKIDDLPEIPFSLYGSGVKIKAREETNVAAGIIAPYYRRHWDGVHAFYYCPPDKATEYAALTVTENVAHFSHNIFTGYHEQSSVHLRSTFKSVLDYFLPEPLLRTENVPPFTRISVTKQKNRRIVHLLAYACINQNTHAVVETPNYLNDFQLELRLDGMKVRAVYVVCGEKEDINFLIEDGYVKVNVSQIYGSAHIIFESDKN